MELGPEAVAGAAGLAAQVGAPAGSGRKPPRRLAERRKSEETRTGQPRRRSGAGRLKHLAPAAVSRLAADVGELDFQ